MSKSQAANLGVRTNDSRKSVTRHGFAMDRENGQMYPAYRIDFGSEKHNGLSPLVYIAPE